MEGKKEATVYSREEYATKEFWDSRYKQKQSYFDWYAEFPQLKQTFQKQYSLTPQDSILMLGCGNSKLSEQMYEAGYHNIFNIDISPAVIEQMAKASAEKGYDKMKWIEMDATDMKTIQDGTFDVIIDKGTLDALISGKNMEICEKMLRESMRVLKRDGQFILITYGSPEGRKRFFENSIGLSKYDYYFTRVDLSSMSTLINLMRSNLGNQPLNAITKDAEAMKKSLMEFNLIKVLRRNRKNEKKYIIWSDFNHKEVMEAQKQGQEGHLEPEKEKRVQKQVPKEKVKAQEKPNPVNYSPKKQSFCYVYSIKQKFANNLQQICLKHPQKLSQTLPAFIKGDQNLQKISIYPANCHQDLIKAITYLQISEIENNPLTICSSEEEFMAIEDGIKINLRQGERCAIPALSKTVYEIEIKGQEKGIKELELLMKEICEVLVEDGGLAAHPSPRDYAYIGILFQKLQLKQYYHKFLETHWYPTFKLLSYTPETSTYLLSVAPTIEKDFILSSIISVLNSHKLKSTVSPIHKGYLHFYDPKVITLINFCSVNYCDGVNAHLIAEEFGTKENEQYACQVPTVYLKKEAMPMILARLLSAI